ncbi:MAG TPA: hypothetical protein VHX36_03655 [Candidatus Acidoferrales bacterium]|nr:hypothetical protein [Candidatus Acidoferrales bacterium]
MVKLDLSAVQFKEWSLSGIEFETKGAIFRCWKGAERELPPPGESKGRRRFLNQQYPLALDFGGVTKIRNFVILYTIGPLNKLTLWLACPKQYDDEERIAEAWWWIEIPEPAAAINLSTNVGQRPSDDLGIEPRAAQKVTDKNG